MRMRKVNKDAMPNQQVNRDHRQSQSCQENKPRQFRWFHAYPRNIPTHVLLTELAGESPEVNHQVQLDAQQNTDSAEGEVLRGYLDAPYFKYIDLRRVFCQVPLNILQFPRAEV